MDEPIELKGTISLDPETGLIVLTLETVDADEYGCLDWSLLPEDPEYAGLMELLKPPPLD